MFTFEKPKPVICKLRNSTQFLVKSRGDIHVLKEIATYDHYGRFLSRLKNNAVVVDIGAHIGVFSILAAQRIRGAKVFSFEPLPENFSLLKANIDLNALSDRVFPFQLAVSGRRGLRRLHFFSERTGSSFFPIPGQRQTDQFDVHSLTLADIFEKNHISRCDFLKIDCEGSESEIIFHTPRPILNG
ncbi:MAG: FkbM family methyltransferase [Candidatus Liptonbacteria bacterium]|nr:FkbM family methyltransferase [Candidatus Liptonbacteria bacterium]